MAELISEDSRWGLFVDATSGRVRESDLPILSFLSVELGPAGRDAWPRKGLRGPPIQVFKVDAAVPCGVSVF